MSFYLHSSGIHRVEPRWRRGGMEEERERENGREEGRGERKHEMENKFCLSYKII